MSADIYILRHGKAQHMIVEEINRVNGSPFHFTNVFEAVEEVPDDGLPVLVCCASPSQKAHDYAYMANHKLPPPFVHPSAIIAGSAKIAPGSIVNVGATIQVHASVGMGCMVHAHVDVAHNAVLDNFANVSPGCMISGHCRIGWGVSLWSGAVILPKVIVGERSIVGANAVVRDDIPPSEYWTGNPARRLAHVKGGEA